MRERTYAGQPRNATAHDSKENPKPNMGKRVGIAGFDNESPDRNAPTTDIATTANTGNDFQGEAVDLNVGTENPSLTMGLEI